MFVPNKMAKVNVLVFSKYLGELTKILGESGLIHLVNAAEESDNTMLRQMDTGNDVRVIEQMLSRCDVLLEALGVEKTATQPSSSNLDQQEISALFEKIDKLYREDAERVTKLIARHSGLDQSTRELENFPLQSLRVETLRNLSQLHVEAGILEGDAFLRARQALSEDALFIQHPDEPAQVLVITSRKRHYAVDDALAKFGFQRMEIPGEISSGTIEEKRAAMKTQLDDLRREINDARMAIVALGEEYGGVLLAIRRQLRELLTIREAQGFFGKARQFVCVTGWIPADELPRLQRMVDKSTDGTGVVRYVDADEVLEGGENDASQIPVQLNDNSMVRPFRALVTNFGMPNYRELDPSFFVGITFLIMFGYMFGDVGQGAVLALAGLFMRFRRSFSATVRDYGFMLIGCGVSAMIFGVLYGSVFGYEELIPHLWLSPSPLHSGIPQLLATSVGIGVIFLSVSLIINIINHFRVKQYLEGSLDKCGLMGLIFYWACLGAAAQVAFTGTISSWTISFIVVPLLLIFLGHPIHNLVKHRSLSGNDGGILNVLITAMIETLETLTGYLSGTFSFVRVGAYAISHAALCLAVYSIMNMLADVPGGLVLQILVAVIGNIFVIAFEGMVAAIQCVRLEYYELFSRYFRGGGVAYKPFKIKDNQ